MPKVLKLSCWLNHGAELITGLEKPTRAALSADDFTPTAGNEESNAQESQIRAFLAWDKLLLQFMLSHIKKLNAMGIQRGLGILWEACKLNMKLWNNCALFIYSMERSSGIPGCWTIFTSEAIKRKFSSYELHCIDSETKYPTRKNSTSGFILSSWKQKQIQSRCQETLQNLWLETLQNFLCKVFQSLQREDLVILEIIECHSWCPSLYHLGPKLGFTTQLLSHLSLSFLASLGEQEALWTQLQMSVLDQQS